MRRILSRCVKLQLKNETFLQEYAYVLQIQAISAFVLSLQHVHAKAVKAAIAATIYAAVNYQGLVLDFGSANGVSRPFAFLGLVVCFSVKAT